MNPFFRLLVIFASVISIGCASLRWDQYNQYIHVSSTPEGAEIYDGSKLLGRTPAIVPVRRGIHPKLELYYPGVRRQKIQLSTKYRFVESMGAGGILITMAPIAWLIDLATGTAWDIQDVKDFKLGEVQSSEPETVRARLITVAPPQSENLETSERVGPFLESQLRSRDSEANNHSQWLKYSDTLGRYYDFQYSNEFRIPRGKDLYLFGPMGVTHVVESEVGTSGFVNYRVRDLRTDEKVDEGQFRLPPNTLVTKSVSFSKTFKRWLLSSIPNTGTIDSSKETTNVALFNRESIIGNDKPMDSVWGEASRFLGTISFTNLLPPHRKKNFEWHFRLTPLLTFAYHRINFESSAAFFNETDFKLLRMSVGIGPQIALESIFGVFYLSAVPGLAYSRLSYDSPVASGSASQTSVNMGIELGYYRFFSERWAFRFSAKSVGEDLPLWNDALDASQGIDVPVESVNQTIIAVSACYYFPDLKRQLNR